MPTGEHEQEKLWKREQKNLQQELRWGEIYVIKSQFELGKGVLERNKKFWLQIT